MSVKNLICLFSLLLFSNILAAQEDNDKPDLRLSYFSQAAIQPGIKIGLQLPFKHFSGEKRRTHLFLGPQLAFYNFPEVHSNGILNLGVGLKSSKKEKQFFYALMPSLGWQYRSSIRSVRVNLENGEKEKIREGQSFLLSSLELTVGGKAGRKIKWFTSLSYGLRFSGSTERSASIFFEAGIFIPLKF